MSHFTVLVIGPDYQKQLAPYHEYECTGVDDEYVIDVDITDEVVEQFAKPQKVIVLADGRVFDRYDEQFYTAEASDDLRRRLSEKEFRLPEGAIEQEMTADEAREHGIGYATMAACADEHFGASGRDGRFYRHTNPQARWDWYTMGGRWTGSLKLKPGKRGIIGSPGLMTERAADGYADQALKGDIDFEQMRNDVAVKARALWKLCREITAGLSWDSWDDTRTRYAGNVQLAREEYWAQPAIELLKASDRDVFRFQIDDALALDEDIYVQRQRDGACVQFAFVRDSQWNERGKMGWWASVHGEVSPAQWNKMFNDMLDALPDDTLLTVVDCHI